MTKLPLLVWFIENSHFRCFPFSRVIFHTMKTLLAILVIAAFHFVSSFFKMKLLVFSKPLASLYFRKFNISAFFISTNAIVGSETIIVFEIVEIESVDRKGPFEITNYSFVT